MDKTAQALSLLIKKLNPTARPNQTVALESIGAEELNWPQIELAGTYLRGLDFQNQGRDPDNTLAAEQLSTCDYLGAHLPPALRAGLQPPLDHTDKLAQWRQPRQLSGHWALVTSVAVVDATRVISGSRDRTLKLWDINSGECLQTFSGHKGWVSNVAVIDTAHVISGGGDGLCLWRVPDKSSTEPVQPETRVFTDNGLVITQTREEEVVFTLEPDTSPPFFICSDSQGGPSNKQFPADPRLYQWLRGIDENGQHFPGFAFTEVWNELDSKDATVRWEDLDEDANPRRLVVRLTP